MQDTSFTSLDEFKSVLAKDTLVFFHIFDSEPDREFLSLFEPSGKADEILLLLDIQHDQGFLASTPITVQVTVPPNRQFISKKLIDLRGVGAWAKGTLFDFEVDRTNYRNFIDKARHFAFGHRPTT